MKKLFLIIPALAVALSSCKTNETLTVTDDVYANPAEEKRLARIAAEQQARKEAEEKELQNQSRLAQKAKDDANPYYQDPAYNSDDYYDYQYASRFRRFSNPIYGAGYYDNYYTNSYWYNQNPAFYGTSIYSTYNWCMPSAQFGYYSGGIGMGWGNPGWGNSYWNNGWGSPYGYGFGSPYGYGYGSPYGYNPYAIGYNQGYYNGYYNGLYGYPYGYGNGWNNGGWGYFNSYDVNSGYANMTFAPRGSNGGNNSPRSTSAGMDVPAGLSNERQTFFNAIKQKQESTPRFTEVPRPKVTKDVNGNPVDVNSGNIGNGNSGYPSNSGSGGGRNTNINSNSSVGAPNIGGNSNQNGNSNNSGTGRPASTRINGSSKAEEYGNSGSTNKSGGGNYGTGNSGNSGGTSSPRNSGGGSNRPR